MKFLVSHFYTRFPLPTIISPHSLDSTRPWGDEDVLLSMSSMSGDCPLVIPGYWKQRASRPITAMWAG